MAAKLRQSPDGPEFVNGSSSGWWCCGNAALIVATVVILRIKHT